MMNVRSMQRSVPNLSPMWSKRRPQRLNRDIAGYMGGRNSSFVATSWRKHSHDGWPSRRPTSQSFRHPNLTITSLRLPFSSQPDISKRYLNEGLIQNLVEPHYDSIRQLPEVDSVMHKWEDTEALEELQRAIQVFEVMEKGGSLHVAVVTLLAEWLQYQGNHQEAARVLQTLEQLVPEANNEARLLVDLASAKTLWYQGDFSDSMKHVKKMMTNEASDSSNLIKGCTLNAEAIVRLMTASNKRDDGGRSIIQMLETASNLIQKDQGGDVKDAMICAGAKGNLGIAMVISNLDLDESKRETDTLDEALNVFRGSLNVIDDICPSAPSSFAETTNLIRAHIYCNMAWTVLQQKDKVKLASEYSSSALSFAEKLQNQVSELEYHRALGRSLRLVACCYARVDSALTAEGLFQTAIDSLKKAPKDPLASLDLRDAHNDYAALLHQWDKRSRDAEIREEKGHDVNDSLPQGWKDQSSICSGLMFITP